MSTFYPPPNNAQQLLSLKAKLLLFSVPFFVLLFAFITHGLNSELYNRIFGFDSFGAYGEWVQFACYSFAGFVGIAAWRLLRSNGLKKEGVLIALFIIGCFFIALEEISYGQWIFKWEAPALFQEINSQKETNLHNTRGVNSHNLFMVVGFFGSFAWTYKSISKSRLFTDLLCPSWYCATYFFPVLAFYFYFDYIRPHYYLIGNHQELFELILSFGFVLVSVSNYRRVVGLAAIKSAPPQP
jgi:hypothetical protein